MNQFRKYIYLLFLMISGIGLFFGDVSLSSVPSSDGTFLTEYHLTANEAFAQGQTDTTKAPPGSNSWTETLNNIILGINFILAAVTAIASVAVGFVSWLLSPDWTSGDLFNLRESLYKLWITVSNIIYFIYAIALIVVAVMTMFNSKNYGYKALLPRLVVGILMVPFTWWAVQFAVSLSTVLTASVLTIPMETINQSDNPKSWWNTPSIPQCIAMGGPDNKENIEQCNEKSEKMRPKEFAKKVGGVYGNLVIYAYGVFKMHTVHKIDTSGIDTIKTAAQIINNGIIGAIMFLIFGIMMIALVFVLVLRVFKLWAYAIFSPIFTFGYVFKDSTKGMDEDETFSVREFVGLVFLPAIIGLILSFGLILINALNSNSVSVKEEPCNIAKLKTPEGCKIASIMGNPDNTITRKIIKDGDAKEVTVTTFRYGGIDMKWYGGSMQGQDAEDVNNAIGVFSTIGGAFGAIFLNLIAIIFVWISFVAAKNVSKTASKIIAPVESAGKSLASAARSAPMHSIKVPGFGNIAGVQTAATQALPNYFRDKSTKEWQRSKVYEMLNKNNPISKEEAKNITSAIKRIGQSARDAEAWKNLNQNAENINGPNGPQNVKASNPKFYTTITSSVQSLGNDTAMKQIFGHITGAKFFKYIKDIDGDVKPENEMKINAYITGWRNESDDGPYQSWVQNGRWRNLGDDDTPEDGGGNNQNNQNNQNNSQQNTGGNQNAQNPSSSTNSTNTSTNNSTNSSGTSSSTNSSNSSQSPSN